MFNIWQIELGLFVFVLGILGAVTLLAYLPALLGRIIEWVSTHHVVKLLVGKTPRWLIRAAQYIGLYTVLTVGACCIGLFIRAMFARENLAEKFKSHIFEWQYAISKLSPNGKLPNRPKLIFLEREDRGEALSQWNQRMGLIQETGKWCYADPPDDVFGTWRVVPVYGIPDAVLAMEPSEVNTVVLISRCEWWTHTYEGGHPGFSQSLTVAIVNTKDRSIIARSPTFCGGDPPKSISWRAGSDAHPCGVGSDPTGYIGWIEAQIAGTVARK
jgi:hypothetical protein